MNSVVCCLEASTQNKVQIILRKRRFFAALSMGKLGKTMYLFTMVSFWNENATVANPFLPIIRELPQRPCENKASE